MNLNLKQLEAFVWAIDLGSFSKAAARLNTTQPNISVRIRSLENALGVQILERDAGSVRLTARGKTLLAHSRDVLNAVESLYAASDDESQRQGTLRLGVTELIVHTWLQDFLKVLNEKYPNIQVELTVDLSANLSRELSERGLDIALQNGPFDNVMSGERDLGTYPLIWVASPQLIFPKTTLKGKALTAMALTKYPILTHARESELFKAISAHFTSEKTNDVNLVPSSNLAACLFMAKNKMGVATLPRTMAADAIQNNELFELNYTWTPDSLTFKARYDENKSPGYVSAIADIARSVSTQYEASTSG